MNKVEVKLSQLKKERRIGLMTHVVIGYPSLAKTISIVRVMEKAGVDFVELQIPFSDPLADGPTIMYACEKSLANGTTVKDSFSVMKQLSSRVSIPLLFMGYYNSVFKYGVERFCRDTKVAGASGVIIPDIPPDEEKHEKFYYFCKKYDLCNIQVVSPASTPGRLKKNMSVARGFVYCASRQGTTGTQDTLDSRITSYLNRVRKYTALPLTVGFGISKKEHIKALHGHTDIVIIGSAIIDLIGKTDSKNIEKIIKTFIDSITP